MSAVKTINVTISRQTAPVSAAGFGLPLILATNAVVAYAEYSDLAAVEGAFASTTAAYKMASGIFDQNPSVEKVAILGIDYTDGVDPVTDLSDALNTLILSENDWYFLMYDDNDIASVTELSTWAEGKIKLFFAQTEDKAFSSINDKDRTAMMYNDATLNLDQFLEARFVGMGAPRDPGSLTWAFKELVNATKQTLTSTEADTLETNKVNFYSGVNGFTRTYPGVVTSGEYIDIIRSQDWLQSNMEFNIARLLATTDKVPFDDNGIQQIVAKVNETLNQAVAQGIIATDASGNGIFTVSFPRRADISDTDVANRTLNGITWAATVAGAIHTVNVSGTLTVSLV